MHILCHISWHFMHILHIYSWWYMLQVVVVYFLDFQKNKNDRTGKTDNYPPAKHYNHSFFSYCLQRGLNPRSQQRNLSPYKLSYRSLRESLFHHCFLPQLRAQLFTYHHLHRLCRPLFCRKKALKKPLECWQRFFASRTVLSLYWKGYFAYTAYSSRGISMHRAA